MGTENQEDIRVCDFCSKTTALLYCRADSAKLCLACDREVHSTNQLFTKHTRWLLCDACDSSPASIFCCTDSSVLCQNCDWEAHNANPTSSLTGIHNRRPLDGFVGRPSVTELLGILGLDDLGKKALQFEDIDKNGNNYIGDDNDNSNSGGDGEYGLVDMFSWDCPAIVSVDELIASDDAINGHKFQATGVPPLPKNRNAVCGRHKDEILQQLREMSRSEPEINDSEGCLDSFIEFQSILSGGICQFEDKDAGLENNVEPTLVPSHEANAFQWSANVDDVPDEVFTSTLLGGSTEANYLVPEKDSDVGDSSIYLNGGQEDQSHYAITSENFHILPNVAVRDINSQERDSAISRYKEKKKTRRYEKHIRYESRKVRAESRTRIKGRFAKKGQREPATQ